MFVPLQRKPNSKKQSATQMAKQNFSYRMSEEKLIELKRLAASHSEYTGKTSTITEVLDMIYELGLPLLKRDIGSGFAVPRSAKTVEAKLNVLSRQFSRKVTEVVNLHTAAV